MIPGVVPMPDEFAARYREAGYWRGDTLGGLLREWAARSGDAIAVTAGESTLTYAELDLLADRLAHHLLALGIAPGDRVVIHLGNVPEFLIALFALLRIGAPPVLALPAHREHELRHLCAHAEAVAYLAPVAGRDFDHQALGRTLRDELDHLAHVIVVGDGAGDDVVSLDALLAQKVDDEVDADAAREEIAAHAPDPDPDPGDVALFLLSGGTTGLPKLIPRTHDDYSYNLRASAELCEVGAEAVYLVALPIAHNFPLACFGVLGTFHAGGRVVLTDDPRAEAALALIAAEGITHTALVPALAIRWMDAVEAGVDADLSTLELLQVGGSRLASEAAMRVGPLLGCRLQQVFGMGEGLLNYTRLDDSEEVIATTQGRPLSPDDELHMVDPMGEPVPDGTPGELLTRGPYTIRGYYRAPEVNARGFTDDGFYRTGDLVVRTPEGNLVVEGRVKDVINRGGEKISAEEIEDVLLAVPAVANVAVIGMPDREMGERVCAYVIVHDDHEVTLEDLRRMLEQRGLARFKWPERVEVVAELPLTNVGKISKVELRADITARLAAERDAPPADGAAGSGV